MVVPKLRIEPSRLPGGGRRSEKEELAYYTR
jgi:hypothetical protein